MDTARDKPLLPDAAKSFLAFGERTIKSKPTQIVAYGPNWVVTLRNVKQRGKLEQDLEH